MFGLIVSDPSCDTARREKLSSLLYELDLLSEYPGAAWPIQRIRHWLAEDIPV